MPQVSINAYVISVDIRGPKTLLVEGSSDKRIIQRIAANDTRYSAGSFVVDSAELLKSHEEDGRLIAGNKDKVLAAHSRLSADEKFAILVDREWDGLRDEDGNWTQFAPPAATNRKIITSGHSIENYSFEPNFFSDAVLSRCYEHFDAESSEVISAHFSNCLLMALAITQVFSNARLLSKSLAIFRPSDFSWVTDDNLIFVEESGILTRMEERNIENAREILSLIQPTYEDHLQNFDCEPIKLYLHGHLGEEVVRAVVAAKVSSSGVPEESVNHFFNEGKEARETRLREYYSQLDDLPISLIAILDFLAA